MKLRFLIPLLVLLFLLSACGEPDPLQTHKFTAYYEEFKAESTDLGRQADPGVVVCNGPGRNCWLFGDLGDIYVIYNRFVTDYTNDNVSRFFNEENWRALFPPSCPVDEDAVTKILNGTYDIKMTSDGSIVVVREPGAAMTEENVLYAIDKP